MHNAYEFWKLTIVTHLVGFSGWFRDLVNEQENLIR